MPSKPATAVLTSAAVSTRTPPLERFTLILGLLFCAACLALVAFDLTAMVDVARAPTDYVASLGRRSRWADALILPLGIATTVTLVLTLLRAWNLRAPRSRWRLVAFVTLSTMSLLEMLFADPIAERIFSSTDHTHASLLADVALLGHWNWVRTALVGILGITLIAAHRAPMPAAVAVSASGLTAHHRTVLFLVGTATFFEGYDRFIVTLALPYIGKDLGANEGALGYALSFIRLGALISIVLGQLADRFGRRRLLIVSVVAYTVATAATAFSFGLSDFALYQLVATVFLAAELTLAQVVIAEEFPAAARGRGQGMLGAFAAMGAGLAALLFPTLQRTDFGWRGMYLIGILPLLVVAYLRRTLPETRRFQAAVRQGAPEVGIRDLFRSGRLSHLVLLTLLSAVATGTAAPAFSFASYRATTVFDWTPGQVSTMIIGGGSLGLIGYFVHGRLADSIGRRWIGCLGLIGGAAAIALFYQSAWLVQSFAMLTFCEAAALIAINSLATELFPTRLRATAKAWITYSATVGAVAGLAAVGVLSGVTGGHAAVVSLFAVVMMLVAPSILLLPETTGIDLEQVDAA